MKSLSYYLVIFVLKLKGIKKLFADDPINYKRIRKDDIKYIKRKWRKRSDLSQFGLGMSQISEWGTGREDREGLILLFHGGAFISGPVQHHWDVCEELYQSTNYKIWLCDYPKAPESKVEEINRAVDEIYARAFEYYSANQLVLMGDSAGGTLVSTLVQRLSKERMPKKLILISPVVDGSLQNPDIDVVDQRDPMLSKRGVLSAKQLFAGNESLVSSKVSPLFGEVKDFPSTILYVGGNDITGLDQLLFYQKMKDAGVNCHLVKGEGLPHIWPLLPIMKEAREGMRDIIKHLNE